MPSAWRRCSAASRRLSPTGPAPAAAGRHRQGPGAPAGRDDRPSAGFAAASTRTSPGSRAHDAQRLIAERQDGQDHDRRPQGRRQPAPRSRQATSSSARTSRASSSSASATPKASPRRSSPCSRRASSTSRRSTSREFKSVISQKPTALQLIPANVRTTAADAAKRRGGYTNTSRTRRRSSATCCRAISRCRFSAALLENAASF